jgi:hypothetical protein
MTSTIKVNTITTESGSTLTVGGCGKTVALASGASQTGFGRTGTVDWDTTPKTTTFTAVAGDGFFCNTTAGAFTCNLPAGSAGAIVSVADYAGTWQNNALTVSPNGTDKIGGVNADVVLNTEGQSVTFIFVDSTQGWINTMDSTSNVRGAEFMAATGGTITTSGNDKIHTFTGPGTFTVTCAAATAANNIVSYLVVAGGGGGGTGDEGGGGGGGAGGYRELVSPSAPYTGSPLNGYPSAPNRVTVSATAYPITVGSGGTANAAGSAPTQGSTSTFSSISSAGGGRGGYGASPYCGAASGGGNGGSGGGGFAYTGPIGGNAAGSGNTPSTTPAQGTNGGTGNGSCSAAQAQNGGGGGGATAVGANGANYPGPGEAGDGGAGATSEITASPVARAGGGGGGRRWDPPSGAPGTGGTGGGGNGGNGRPPASTGTAGTVNTGGGGGAGGGCSGTDQLGGNGGSGIVVIRYKYQ